MQRREKVIFAIMALGVSACSATASPNEDLGSAEQPLTTPLTWCNDCYGHAVTFGQYAAYDQQNVVIMSNAINQTWQVAGSVKFWSLWNVPATLENEIQCSASTMFLHAWFQINGTWHTWVSQGTVGQPEVTNGILQCSASLDSGNELLFTTADEWDMEIDVTPAVGNYTSYAVAYANAGSGLPCTNQCTGK
jgi:hypothetical protein